MKKIIIRLFIFIMIIYIADRMVGFLLSKLYQKSSYYPICKLKHTLNAKEDVLIFGSSRAEHHYSSSILSKELGKSVYNCGFGGQGLEFSFLQLNEILKQNKPNHIILDISVNNLLDPDAKNKLRILSPYYNQSDEILNSLKSISYYERFKMYSKLYNYNTNNFYIFIKNNNYKLNDSFFGFKPLNKNFDTTGIYRTVSMGFNEIKDITVQMVYVNKFLNLCYKKNIPLTIVISPIYLTNGVLDNMNRSIKNNILINNNVSFFDFSLDTTFNKHPAYFVDNLHLNETGACLFTKILSKKIRKNE